MAGTAAMATLLPFGLVGACAGWSIGATAGAIFFLEKAHTVIGIPLRSIVAAVWPAAIAACLMAAALLPLEYLLVDAASRGTVLGLALLTGEAMAGVAIYLLLLRLLAPDAGEELRTLTRAVRRRRAAGSTDQPLAVDPAASDA